MAKLEIVNGQEDLQHLCNVVWKDHHGQEYVPPMPIIPRHSFPCLVGFLVPVSNSGRSNISLVICSRAEAKRLVYPKTNYNRSDGSFILISGSVREKLADYMVNKMRSLNVSVSRPEQRRLYDLALFEVGSSQKPILVTTRGYQTRSRRLVNFFIVDVRDAHKLVYFNKMRKPPKLVIDEGFDMCIGEAHPGWFEE